MLGGKSLIIYWQDLLRHQEPSSLVCLDMNNQESVDIKFVVSLPSRILKNKVAIQYLK